MTLPWRSLALPAAIGAAALGTRILIAHAPARVTVDLAQPLVVVTNWGSFGAALLAIVIGALAAAAIGYAALLRRAGSLPFLVTVVALSLAAAWCVPVLFSSDVYAYAAYGELARLGIDPYAHAPLVPHNPLLAAASWQWNGTLPICVYGPAFVGLARAAVGALSSLGTVAQLDGVRALASAALLLCAPLAYAAFPGEARAKLRAAATIVANPAAIWCASEGHNDAIALFIVLAGFAVAGRGFLGAGGAIVALSAAFKPPGTLAAIALGALHPRARLGVALGLALCAILSYPLLLGVVTRLAPHAHYAPEASLQAIVAPLGAAAAFAVAGAICAVVVAGAVTRLRRGRRDGWLRLAIGAWVLVPNPYPWYGVWLVALAAFVPRSRASAVALGLSFSTLLRYAPDAVGTPGRALSIALGAAATLPLLLLFAGEDHDPAR